MRSEGREVSLFEAPIAKSAWRRLLLAGSLILSSLCVVRPALGSENPGSGIVDLSLMVAPNLPATWPHPKVPNFQISHYLKIGPGGAYNSDILTIDGNTGTQLDVPPHSVARPELGFPNSGPYGHMFIDRVPPWQFGGEACVVDLRSLRDAAAKGHSALIERKHVSRPGRGNTGLYGRAMSSSSTRATATTTTSRFQKAAASSPRPSAATLRVGPIPAPIAWNTWPAAASEPWAPTVPAWARCPIWPSPRTTPASSTE